MTPPTAHPTTGYRPAPWRECVRTVPVDTNVLRNDVLRRTRLIQASQGRMLTAAVSGGLRIFVPRHVPREMDAHIRDFARKAGLDPDLATRLWVNEYRPKMTAVDVNDLVDVFGGHPLVAATLARDPDDAPLACLAVLLGQPALSEDADLGRAGTGRPWLDHLIAVTDAVMSDNTTAAVAWGGVAAAGGIVRSGRSAYEWLERTFGSTGAALVALALVGAAALALSNDGSRRWIVASPPARVATRAVVALGEGVLGVLARGGQADAYLRLAALQDDVATPPVASLFRVLASSRFPMTAAQVATRLGWPADLVEQTLDAHAAFVPTADGRWQVGFALPPQPPPTVALGRPIARALPMPGPLRYAVPWGSDPQ